MKKFRIVPKRDFGSGKGFWLPGVPGGTGTKSYGWVKSGFVVTDGFCNIMPGAAWFRTVAEAMDALAILIRVGGEKNAGKFWEEYRKANG